MRWVVLSYFKNVIGAQATVMIYLFVEGVSTSKKDNVTELTVEAHAKANPGATAINPSNHSELPA